MRPGASCVDLPDSQFPAGVQIDDVEVPLRIVEGGPLPLGVETPGLRQLPRQAVMFQLFPGEEVPDDHPAPVRIGVDEPATVRVQQTAAPRRAFPEGRLRAAPEFPATTRPPRP